jgi:hypothetical protein
VKIKLIKKSGCTALFSPSNKRKVDTLIKKRYNQNINRPFKFQKINKGVNHEQKDKKDSFDSTWMHNGTGSNCSCFTIGVLVGTLWCIYTLLVAPDFCSYSGWLAVKMGLVAN